MFLAETNNYIYIYIVTQQCGEFCLYKSICNVNTIFYTKQDKKNK